jgi:hypothetical protein
MKRSTGGGKQFRVNTLQIPEFGIKGLAARSTSIMVLATMVDVYARASARHGRSGEGPS